MGEYFKIIAITRPDFFEDEVKMIIDILNQGRADIIHLRKPGSNSKDIENLIEKIPEEYHPRLKIHDHFELTDKFKLAGIHLNSRNPVVSGSPMSVSRSMHSIEELKGASRYDYVTLSPIFDSISKQGYKAAFNLDMLRNVLKERRNVIALGGVTPEKYQFLKELGFCGAALLSHFFNGEDNRD